MKHASTPFHWLLRLSLVLAVILSGQACKSDPVCPECEEPGEEPIGGSYDPQAYELEAPGYLPTPIIPADNPLTEAGVRLGRMLFYDPILSDDGSMSCAGCHAQEKAFTDGLPKSVGILGLETRRNAMALVNLSFNNNGFFWDGRAATLEEQALQPIEAHDEFNSTWEEVEERLRSHSDYPSHFRAAFGITYPSEITRDLAAKAMAQFERILISADSKYDKVVWRNEDEFTDSEQRGYDLFQIETAITIGHPGCTHCHGEPQMTDNLYRNNGLDEVENLEAFADKGRGEVTGIVYDNGKFRAPTLRNIALTAPYMHDGRFETLEEVLDHYASGGHGVANEDVNIRPFDLSEQEKTDLIAFLHTLTDSTFIQNPAYSSPF